MMKQVLVTRPEHQSQSLMRLLQQHQYQPILLPAIDIEFVEDDPQFQQAMKYLGLFDVLIVTSVNAVYACQHHLSILKRCPNVDVLSIGPATTKALQSLGVEVTATASPACSESLLAMSILNEQINIEKVLIATGFDPKPLLRDVLLQRGALVEDVFCYRRVMPDALIEQQLWQKVDNTQPILTITTSAHALKNLLSILPVTAHGYFFQNPLVVISKAMQLQAVDMGFEKVYLSESASDIDLMACVSEHIVF